MVSAMRLAPYLEREKISDADFAEKIGVSRQAVHRYRTGERVPDQPIMHRIAETTAGEVLPNDFYDVPQPAHPAAAATS